MITLNSEILGEILFKAVNDETSLTKFMLSGKEAFQAVLNHLSCSQKVTIGTEKMDVIVKIKPNRSKRYVLRYNFHLLKPLFLTICESHNELNIDNWPKDEYFGKFNFDKFIGNRMGPFYMPKNYNENLDLTKFEYSRSNFLSQHCEDLVLKCENIKTVKVSGALFFTRISPSSNIKIYQKMSPLPSSCRELILDSFNFCNFLDEKPEDISFSKIEKLMVYGDFEPVDFKVGKMKRFSLFISKNFPNLKTLEMNLEVDRCNWRDMFEKLQSMNPSVFQSIPLNVKGFIEFLGDFNINKYSSFLSMANKNNDMVVKEDEQDETAHVTKEFLIHEGLTFKFFSDFNYSSPSYGNPSDDDFN